MLIAVRTLTTLVNSESLTYHLAVYLFNAPKYAPGPTPGSEHAVGTAQTCDVPGGGEGGQRGTQTVSIPAASVQLPSLPPESSNFKLLPPYTATPGGSDV